MNGQVVVLGVLDLTLTFFTNNPIHPYHSISYLFLSPIYTLTYYGC